jgi:hypothetical protein
MANKMPPSFELVLMVSCAWLRGLELETLPLEMLGVLINFGWRTRSLKMQTTAPLLDVHFERRSVLVEYICFCC